MTANPVPYAFDALDRACEFYEAFQQLPPLPRGRWISWPRYFLLCHAVEIGLKAFLASRGVPEPKLRAEFGHKIDPLMRAALAKGLDIGVFASSALMQLDEAHAKHWPRYPREEGEQCLLSISILSSHTHGNCFRGCRNRYTGRKGRVIPPHPKGNPAFPQETASTANV